MMEYLIKYLTISTEPLVTHLGYLTTDALSQSYPIHYDDISNGLIDSRGGKKVEHRPLPNNRGRFPKFSAEDFTSQQDKTDLTPTDVEFQESRIIVLSMKIIAQSRRPRNRPRSLYCTRQCGRTKYTVELGTRLLHESLLDGTAISSGHGGACWILAIQTG